MNQEDHVDACLALDSYRNLFHFKFVRCKYKRSAAKCSIWRSNCDSRRHDIVSHGPAQPCWAQLSDLEALGFEILSRTPNLRTVHKGAETFAEGYLESEIVQTRDDLAEAADRGRPQGTRRQGKPN